MEYLITHSALCYPKSLPDFLEDLPLNFINPLCKRVLDMLLQMQDQGRLITLETLSLELGEQVSTSPEFLKILETTPAMDYLALKEDFKKYLLLKAQAELGRRIAQATREGVIYDVEFLSAFAQIELEHRFLTLYDFFQKLECGQIKDLPKVATGIDFLDRGLGGGIALAQLVLMSGDKDAGKTLLCLQMLQEALAQGYKACYFCYEFALTKYILDTKVRGFKQDARAYYLEGQYISLDDLCIKIRNLALKYGVKFFVIDSQQSLTVGSANSKNSEELETQKFLRLSALAISLEVIILLIIQTSKGDDKSPLGSKRGGHIAHMWLHLKNADKKDKRLAWVGDKKLPYVRLLSVQKNKQNGFIDARFFIIDRVTYTMSALIEREQLAQWDDDDSPPWERA